MREMSAFANQVNAAIVDPAFIVTVRKKLNLDRHPNLIDEIRTAWGVDFPKMREVLDLWTRCNGFNYLQTIQISNHYLSEAYMQSSIF